MWTPKRIVLLALGFFVFFSGYMLYASARRHRRPAAAARGRPAARPRPLRPGRCRRTDSARRQAAPGLRPGLPELKWPLKLELNSKNMVVAAAIHHPGRRPAPSRPHERRPVRQGPRRRPRVEINTVRASSVLTFDKKLARPTRTSAAPHRRRRADRRDTTSTSSTTTARPSATRPPPQHRQGPPSYDEAQSLIWTDDNVRVEDDQNQPPTIVARPGHGGALTTAEDGRPYAPAPRQATQRRLHRRGTHRPVRSASCP